MKKPKNSAPLPNPTDHQVIILTGEFTGVEGYCLGPTHDGMWAVTPNSSNRVLSLRFDDEFGILINKGQAPGTN